MSSLRAFLRNTILLNGPISLSTFMKYAMIHPTQGYYTSKQPLGRKGDFVTSPEVCQMFGECVAIKIACWAEAKHLSTGIQLIELGPGRGTLTADILRTLHQLKSPGFVQACTFVEVNEQLRQEQSLMIRPYNLTSQWIPSIDHLEREFHKDDSVVILAHEFFDALPIFAFARNETGSWREILVGVAADGENLSMFLSKTPTTAQLALRIDELYPDPQIKSVEVSPEMQRVAAWMKGIMAKSGPSLSIIVDYGQNQTPQSSLRAIKDHKILPDPLQHIGECDLSVDVDFKQLASIFSPDCKTQLDYQGKFLLDHGIRERTLRLIQCNNNGNATESIRSAYERLVSPTQMGQTYKVLTVEN